MDKGARLYHYRTDLFNSKLLELPIIQQEMRLYAKIKRVSFKTMDVSHFELVLLKTKTEKKYSIYLFSFNWKIFLRVLTVTI